VGPADQLWVFAVDREKLAPREHSTVMSPATFEALERESGLSGEEISLSLGTPVRVTDNEVGLSEREQEAALAGIDLGAP
jgi:hypothetical protein